MKKKILIIIIVCIAGAAATGLYLFNKPRQSVLNVKPVFTLQANDLVSEYETDENASNGKYLGKVIEVRGIITATNIDDTGTLNIILAGVDLASVSCQFENSKNSVNKKLNIGDTVTIKGICTGILIDVVLVDCVLTG